MFTIEFLICMNDSHIACCKCAKIFRNLYIDYYLLVAIILLFYFIWYKATIENICTPQKNSPLQYKEDNDVEVYKACCILLNPCCGLKKFTILASD